MAHTARMGKHILAGLESVAEESRGLVSNVRGKGLMVAFDLPSREARQKMTDNMKNNGLYALTSGEKSVRFRGMLDTPKEVVDKAVNIVATSIPVD